MYGLQRPLPADDLYAHIGDHAEVEGLSGLLPVTAALVLEFPAMAVVPTKTSPVDRPILAVRMSQMRETVLTVATLVSS